MHIVVESAVVESPRVAQVRGLFDLEQQPSSRLEWDIRLPLHERPWVLGLVVGPSGCGKSTVARHLWPTAYARQAGGEDWPADRAVVDAFPPSLSVKEVVELLSAVGFASPPAWLRPFRVLSTGQQFRVRLALLLAEAPVGEVTVLDEFTSTVDRTVARIGSAAVGKAVRRRGQQFVAISCHEDIEAWLQPDWVYRPAENLFAWRCLQRRPEVELHLFRCRASAWPLFAPHHYLSHALQPSAVCFLAVWQSRPVAFSAWLPFVGRGRRSRREHRTVVLPDYQGIGLGNVVSATVASLWKGLGYRALSTTTHPGLIRARMRSGAWRMTRVPSLASGRRDRLRHATTRLTAGFEYVGPAMKPGVARTLLGC